MMEGGKNGYNYGLFPALLQAVDLLFTILRKYDVSLDILFQFGDLVHSLEKQGKANQQGKDNR